MSLATLGISHQTAPISIRERLAFPAESLSAAVVSLAAVPGVRGCSVLSTCNRTELYVSADQTITQEVMAWLHQWHGLRPGEFREHLYLLEGSACVHHLIKVIAGMDSMVIGEPQVAGQAKSAWQAARAAGVLDTPLDRMFQHAFSASKRVRSETGIGQNPVTLPHAALRLVRQIFGDMGTLRILLIGAGEMIEDCATHFHAAGVGRLTIANRNPERAQRLGRRFDAESIGLDSLADRLTEHDVVIASTASPRTIIDRKTFEKALQERRRRPIFALDLAVPRNLDPEATALEDLYLYTIDDLRDIVEASQKRRQAALGQAGAIVEAEVTAFERWLRLQATASTIKSLRQQAEHERDHLLERAQRELARGEDPDEVMHRFSHKLLNRLLHLPSIRLREAAESGDEDLLAAARFFFRGEKE
jgi:glutamyl-tRNA reductase